MKRGPGSKVDKLLCFLFCFSNCSLTLLHINKLMTKSHRELPWITGKSRGKETSFFLNSSKQGLLTATDETGLLFSFTSAIHPPHWASFWSVSFPPSLFFSPRRKWPWRVGRLWAEASQSRFEKRGRRSETSRWIFRPHVGAARAHAYVCVCACAPAGGCRRRLAWHRSRFQRLPRKWGRNDPANSVLKTDRESDFGELTTTHKGQVELKKKGEKR